MLQSAMEMTAKSVNPSLLPRIIALVATIDLTMVRNKLKQSTYPIAWDELRLDRAELLYRRYLTMNLLYPGATIVPTEDVDAFWHQHILDTKAYADDCQRVFGYFLHHFPYLGLRGDEAALNTAFEQTRKLYEALFHQSYTCSADVHGENCCGSCSCSGEIRVQ